MGHIHSHVNLAGKVTMVLHLFKFFSFMPQIVWFTCLKWKQWHSTTNFLSTFAVQILVVTWTLNDKMWSASSNKTKIKNGPVKKFWPWDTTRFYFCYELEVLFKVSLLAKIERYKSFHYQCGEIQLVYLHWIQRNKINLRIV